MEKSNKTNLYLNGILGLIVGDALGVPVEFKEREELKQNPVTSMREYGTYNQPKGTWSDDSSMALATLDSLNDGYNLTDIMDRFVLWFTRAEYTPYKEVFDIGYSTRNAIVKYMYTGEVTTCGGNTEYDNGNGSLMRILPVCLYLYEQQKKANFTEDEVIEKIHEVSGLTHNHIRSKMACGLYYFLVKAILETEGSIFEKMQRGIDRGIQYYMHAEVNEEEIRRYSRLKNMTVFSGIMEEKIKSTGYVVDSLEAAVWCVLTTNTYRDCVLKAVNLGRDTDTVGAIAGGLGGLIYGYKEIPAEWLEVIARRDWIIEMCRESL